MSKLHELIAVEKDIKSTADKIIKETHKTFTDKVSHFHGFDRRYEPLKVDDNEKLDGERKEIVTTVGDKLQYFHDHMIKLFDLMLQKESSNIIAKADIVVDGNVFAKDVPVTYLVQIEKVLEGLRNQIYNYLPTFDPGIDWKRDEAQKNVYRSPELKKLRTKKVPRVMELSKATKEHKAQVQIVTEDINVGYWITKDWTGKISPLEKSEFMARLDNLITAIKKARSRANFQEVQIKHIGSKIFNYIRTQA